MQQVPTGPLPRRRAVMVHGLAQAERALLAAHAAPCRLLLLSAPGAANYLGPGWWLALSEALRQHPLARDAVAQLDCGASAGRAMEALRIGLRRLILLPECPQFAAVQARAAGIGVQLDAVRPETLDLASAGAERRLAQWLSG